MPPRLLFGEIGLSIATTLEPWLLVDQDVRRGTAGWSCSLGMALVSDKWFRRTRVALARIVGAPQGARRCQVGWLVVFQGTVVDVPIAGSRSTCASGWPSRSVGVPRIDVSSGAHSHEEQQAAWISPG